MGLLPLKMRVYGIWPHFLSHWRNVLPLILRDILSLESRRSMASMHIQYTPQKISITLKEIQNSLQGTHQI